MDWSAVMFLSDSHSDGTHSLQSIHCWDTDAETHFSKSDEETNSSTSWTTWECISVFGWTVPLTQGVNRATNLQYEHVLHICVCVQQYTDDWREDDKKVKGYAHTDVAIALM